LIARRHASWTLWVNNLEMSTKPPSNQDHTSAPDPSGSGADVSAPEHSPLANPRLNIVLVEPEIPNNTGNIGRTCVTTGCRLHLVHPLGFETDEKACRRAGLDYWPRLDLVEHDSLLAYQQAHPVGPRTWFLTTKASRTIYDAPIGFGDHVVFGRESAGLPDWVHATHPDRRVCVPLVEGERSLNLSTCVAVVVYESIRKMIGSGDVEINVGGRLVGGDDARRSPRI